MVRLLHYIYRLLASEGVFHKNANKLPFLRAMGMHQAAR